LRSDRYAVGGTTLRIDRETLSKAVDVNSQKPVLERAAADGNATLAAARRLALVASTDREQHQPPYPTQ
jgi:hypothetical protein